MFHFNLCLAIPALQTGPASHHHGSWFTDSSCRKLLHRQNLHFVRRESPVEAHGRAPQLRCFYIGENHDVTEPYFVYIILGRPWSFLDHVVPCPIFLALYYLVSLQIWNRSTLPAYLRPVYKTNLLEDLSRNQILGLKQAASGSDPNQSMWSPAQIGPTMSDCGSFTFWQSSPTSRVLLRLRETSNRNRAGGAPAQAEALQRKLHRVNRMMCIGIQIQL